MYMVNRNRMIIGVKVQNLLDIVQNPTISDSVLLQLALVSWAYYINGTGG